MRQTLKNQLSPIHIISVLAIVLLATVATNDQVTQTATGAFSEITTLDSGAAPQPETTAEETNTVDLQQGLQGYWRFDHPEVSRGNSLEFDGAEDRVQISDDDSLDFASNFTVSFWGKSVEDQSFTFIGKTDQWFGTGTPGWHISAANSAEDVYYETQDGSDRSNVRFRVGRTFKWKHFAVVREGNNVTLYRNGTKFTEVSSSVHGADTTNNIPLIIGDTGESEDQHLNGSMADVRLYNRSLSSSEVQDLYNERPVSREGLVLHQDFNEGPNDCDLTSGTTCLEDESGEENDGTPQGFDDNQFNTGSGWFNQTPLNRPSLEDSSENSNTGRFYGGNNGQLNNFDFNSSSGWLSGQVGEYALKFDGKNDSVIINRTKISTGDTKHSISAWIKIEDYQPGRAWLLVLGQDSKGSHHWIFRDGNSPQFGVWSDAQCKDFTLPRDQWVHMTVTYDGDKIRCFKDGTLVGEKTASFNFTTNNMTIGMDRNDEYSYEGTVDDVRLYSRAISKKEIRSLYSGESVTKGLVGRWNFEAGDRKTAYDTSGLIGRGILDTNSPVLDGVDDHIGFGGPVVNTSNPFTAFLWVNVAESSSGFHMLANHRNSRGFVMEGPGGYQCVLGNGEGFDGVYTSQNLKTKLWESLAMTFNGTHIDCYLDGRLLGTAASNGSRAPENLWLGEAAGYPGGNVEMKTDEVRIYNRSLSKKEIQRLTFR